MKEEKEREGRFLKCRRDGEAECAERKSLDVSIFKGWEAWKGGLAKFKKMLYIPSGFRKRAGRFSGGFEHFKI